MYLPVLAVIVGILILMIVGQVPILGWLVSCIVGLLGMGAVVLTRFGTRVYPTPPTMMLVPAAGLGGAGVPSTYTPTAVDTAAWEAKAREAQARDATQPAPGASDIATSQPAEPGAETKPNDSEPPKPNM